MGISADLNYLYRVFLKQETGSDITKPARSIALYSLAQYLQPGQKMLYELLQLRANI